MNYKLLAVDMDGTLLNDQSAVTEKTKDAVLRAIGQGMLFVPSTGRPLCGMGMINEMFGRDADLPFILFNGAMAMTGNSRQILFSQNLQFPAAREIYVRGVDHGFPVVLWAGEHLFVSHDCEQTRNYQSIVGADMQLIADINRFEGEKIVKMIWIVPPDEALGIQREEAAVFHGRVNCHTSRPYLLEFVDVGASKAQALREVGRVYGIEPSEMVAIGDGYNDVSMLEFAGLGIAMQNAPDDIKKICQQVTSSNNDDGVAKAIFKYILDEREDQSHEFVTA